MVIQETLMRNPPPASYVIKWKFSELEAFLEVLGDWTFSFRQIDRGLTSIHVSRASCGRIHLGHAHFDRRYEQRNILPPGMRTFALLDGWKTDVHWREKN